jgi:ribosome-interacting GTPase 1
LGVPEKIKKIEEDLLKTQVNKHTERHIGVLRAKLSKLKLEQEEQQARRSGSTVGYDVKKSGDGTVVLIGMPSVGKSTLLNVLTNAKSKVAASPRPPGNHPRGVLRKGSGKEGSRGGAKRRPHPLRNGRLPARSPLSAREGAQVDRDTCR